MKSGRTQVEIIALYEELGSYRAVAAVVGCDHKTVKRYVQAAGDAGQLAPVLTRSRVTDDVGEVIAERVEQTHAKVTARDVDDDVAHRAQAGALAERDPQQQDEQPDRHTCAPQPHTAAAI